MTEPTPNSAAVAGRRGARHRPARFRARSCFPRPSCSSCSARCSSGWSACGGGVDRAQGAPTTRDPPVLARRDAPADRARRCCAAHERLARPLVDAAADRNRRRSRGPPTPRGAARRRAAHNYGAVLTGTPRRAAADRHRRADRALARAAVALMAATRAGPDAGSTRRSRSQPTATSQPSQKRSRAVATAQAAQTLLFLLTMLLAGMVLSNLVEEKANKIIEILAAAIPMDAVFLGKLFAMLAVSFVGIAVWGALAAVGDRWRAERRCRPRSVPGGRLAAVPRAVPRLFRDGLSAARLDLPDHRLDGGDGARGADAVDAGDDAPAAGVLPRHLLDQRSPARRSSSARSRSRCRARLTRCSARAAQEPDAVAACAGARLAGAVGDRCSSGSGRGCSAAG